MNKYINIIEYLSSEPTTDNFKAQTKLVSNLIENYLTYKLSAIDSDELNSHKKFVNAILDTIISDT